MTSNTPCATIGARELVQKIGVREARNDRTNLEVWIKVDLIEQSRVHRVGESEGRPSLTTAKDEVAQFFLIIK
ncbi:hypothetical protein NSPZN2_30292 [Nitrospira defluvii]|uniref:Uncharacterized protein n=1 Tax=Nitrospira defluvii TaxID=330214 RepID=A0ABM8RHJ1_9BACT|nr:hypothetical protein NSPZN2_30292 [Nitrospira defluvii]